MILPTDILPSALGLKWGMSKDQCLLVLKVSALKRSITHLIVELPIGGKVYLTDLSFEEGGGLSRITVVLYESRDFWDDFTYEEMEAITSRLQGHYDRLIQHCATVLGSPKFSGRLHSEGYPKDQTAWQITYWDHPESRMQIELDHPDKEFPIVVRVACYTRQAQPSG